MCLNICSFGYFNYALDNKSCRAVAFLLESQGERQHPSTSAPTQSEFIYVGLE